MVVIYLFYFMYKMVIVMVLVKLELLYIIYVDSICIILEEKNLEVLKIICFYIEGFVVLGLVGKQIFFLGDLVVIFFG